jgi:arylsulfatase A-like enzyme
VVDEQIGRVLNMVERLNLTENTLIIVSSDHGDYLGDHHMQQKAFFHDVSSKVPLIFCGPGVKPGHVAKENVSLVDLFPTLLDYCDFLPPSRRDEQDRLISDHPLLNPEARSFLPALQGGDLSQERIILSETGIYGQGMMAKVGSHKYNYYPQTNEFDFFDLNSDPDELNNLGRTLTFESLPPAVREAFDRILKFTRPMQAKNYSFDGKIFPMFT